MGECVGQSVKDAERTSSRLLHLQAHKQEGQSKQLQRSEGLWMHEA